MLSSGARAAAAAGSAPLLHCSFCARDNTSVRKLIAGPGVYICDACIGACQRILDKPRGEGEEAAPAAEQEEGGGGAVDPSGAAFGNWHGLPDDALLRAVGNADRAVQDLRGVLRQQVSILRERGTSWSSIGVALGTSRQAAWERFALDPSGPLRKE